LVIGLPQVKMPGNEKAAVVGRDKVEKKIILSAHNGC
jgi:hypothetical protein